MALVSTQFMGAVGLYNDTGQLDKLDISDVLAAIIKKDTALLGQLKMGGTVKNLEHFWIEDTLNDVVFKASISAGSSSDFAEMVVLRPSTTTALARVVRGGAIARIEGAPQPELFLLSSLAASTTITITPYGSTTVSGSGCLASLTAGASARMFVIGMPKGDMATYSDDISQSRTTRKNWTQVFERGIQITETRKNITLNAIADELKHQIKMRTYEIKRELNNAVLNSMPYHTGGAASAAIETRTMAGIINLIRDPGLSGTNADTTVTNAAGGALTMGKINDLCALMFDYGGFSDDSDCFILCGPYQARVLALIEEGRIRKSSKELIVGSYANKVKTDLGYELDVVIDRWCPGDMLCILDRNAIEIKALQGDAWHLEKMAKTGRNEGYQLSGQYTLEVRNADARCGMIRYLAYTATSNY